MSSIHIRPIPRPRKVCNTPIETYINPDVGSVLYKLLNPNPVKYFVYKFTPLVHADIYFTDLEDHGEDSTKSRELHAAHPYVPSPPIPKRSWSVPNRRDHIPVSLVVTASGKVRCHIRPSMADLYGNRCYHKPSIDVRLNACKDFGYPHEVLLDVLEKHENRLAENY